MERLDEEKMRHQTANSHHHIKQPKTIELRKKQETHIYN